MTMSPIKRTALVAALAMMPLLATAQSKLRAADSLPAGHFFAEQGLKFWVAEARRLGATDLEIEHFPAEQLGKAKDMFQLAMTGVADIAYVVPSYVSDKMPLMTVSELPGLASSSCHGTTAFMKMVRGGLLEQRELKPAGAVILFGSILDPYQVYTAKKIDSLAGINGLKFRTAGGTQGATMKALGGVSVSMTAPETYESLSRGTVDGIVFPYASLLAYDLGGLLKAGTRDVSFGTTLLTYVMSEKKFKSMPAAVQQAMLKAGDAAAQNVCKFLDASVAANMKKIEAKGVTYFKLNDKDAKTLADVSTTVQKEWAEQLDRRGKAGTDVLKAYTDALR